MVACRSLSGQSHILSLNNLTAYRSLQYLFCGSPDLFILVTLALHTGNIN